MCFVCILLSKKARMLIVRTPQELSKLLDNELFNTKKIGFVPTMGALHNGHISLLTSCQSSCEVSIVSIFVNPTQFNSATDFEKYPITTHADIALLQAANCTILYLPTKEAIYPNGTDHLVHYNINNLDTKLEGEFRPGHFQGVCNVVHILLKQVKPHHLFMGAKDFQQCMVIKQLIKSLQIPTELHICHTLRTETGLAMSSRNARLSAEGIQKAASIYQCLQICSNTNNDSFEKNKQTADEILLSVGFTLEYILLANAETLAVLENYETNTPMVILLAAWLEGVRLIDNMTIN
jgi:pantoate--beta-alanine ligase